ncbi:hypothetical protein A6U86_34395 [Rhizobium sp. AC27/96]|nr:hypothetical protein A6U86_34395 [Rhizobium sp. AC27/96]
MVVGQNKDMRLIPKLDQAAPNQGGPCKIEGGLCFRPAKLGQMLQSMLIAAKVVVNQVKSCIRIQKLNMRLAALGDKHAPQSLVTRPHPVQTMAKGLTIKGAMQSQGQRNMIARTDPVQLSEEPQALLGK